MEEEAKDKKEEKRAAKNAAEEKRGQTVEEKPAGSLLRRLTADDQEEIERPQKSYNFRAIMGGDLLTKGWFRKNFWYIVMVVLMTIVYVSGRYSCQQEMIATKALSDTLLDRRYKALTCMSQLKERTRRSVIEESLADTALQTSVTPSYNLKVDEE